MDGQKKASSRTLQLNLAQVIQDHERGRLPAKSGGNAKKKTKNQQKSQTDPEELINNLKDMFPGVDRSVVELLLQEHDFDAEAAIAQLFSMTGQAEGKEAPKQTTQTKAAMTDEELARKLAVEMEREERERRAAQEKADAAMARTMMNTDEKSNGKNAGSVDARGERGKWNVKQPPNADQAPANSDAGVEDSSDGAFEPYLSKKARRRRNKRLNLEKAASAANEQKPAKQDGEGDRSQEEKPATPQDREAVLAFLKSIFTSLDESLIHIVYEENDWDMESTTEALIMLTPADGADALSSTDDDTPASGADSPASTSSSGSPSLSSDDEDEGENVEDWERIDEIIARMVNEGEKENQVEEDSDEEDLDSLAEIKRRYGELAINDEQAVSASGSELSATQKGSFTSNLDRLAEMFPEYDRQALAVALEANGDDIELTTEELLAQAFNNSLRRSGGRIAHARIPSKQRKPTWGIRQDEVLAKMGVAGKVQTPPPMYIYQPTATQGALQQTRTEQPPMPTSAKLDMSAKLKLQSLAQHFWSVDSEMLQSVFIQCGCNVGRTIRALNELDPTLMRKRQAKEAARPQGTDKVEALTKQSQPAQQPEEPKPNPKRRPSQERKERRRQEKFTVVTRKKRSARGSHARHERDIDLRQAALDHASLRNKYYMEATQAYLRGDGQAAKLLSQKGREHDERMKEYFDRAADQIFAPNDSSLHTVDLHKLTVPVALNVLERLLQLHEQRRRRNPNASSWVSVITGIGRHSQGGRAQIKPAVVRYLKENRYQYREVDGVVFIRIR